MLISECHLNWLAFIQLPKGRLGVDHLIPGGSVTGPADLLNFAVLLAPFTHAHLKFIPVQNSNAVFRHKDHRSPIGYPAFLLSDLN